MRLHLLLSLLGMKPATPQPLFDLKVASSESLPWQYASSQLDRSTNSSIRFYIYCISIYNVHKGVWFHPLLLVGVELCLSIYIAFSLKIQKTKCHQALLKHTNTDPIYPSSVEMKNDVTKVSVKAIFMDVSPDLVSAQLHSAFLLTTGKCKMGILFAH